MWQASLILQVFCRRCKAQAQIHTAFYRFHGNWTDFWELLKNPGKPRIWGVKNVNYSFRARTSLEACTLCQLLFEISVTVYSRSVPEAKVLIFIPCDRKCNQSHYRKAIVYSTVLHRDLNPRPPDYRSGVITTTLSEQPCWLHGQSW